MSDLEILYTEFVDHLQICKTCALAARAGTVVSTLCPEGRQLDTRWRNKATVSASTAEDEYGIMLREREPGEVAAILAGVCRRKDKKIDELRKSVLALLEKYADPDRCKKCGAKMYWILTKAGKASPLNVEGVSHFADCPHAPTFRRKK